MATTKKVPKVIPVDPMAERCNRLAQKVMMYEILFKDVSEWFKHLQTKPAVVIGFMNVSEIGNLQSLQGAIHTASQLGYFITLEATKDDCAENKIKVVAREMTKPIPEQFRVPKSDHS
jgi:hypothetical protein